MEDNTPQTEASLTKVFEQALHDKPDFVPEDLPTEWTVGQHRYYRTPDREGALSAELMHFQDIGVKVLDYDRRWGFWIFKTMAPKDAAS